MKHDYLSSAQELRAVIERNYAEFEKAVLGWETPEAIYGFAADITAVRDAYFYMTTHDWTDEDEAEYLLTKENPLGYLAGVWKNELEDLGRHFGRAVSTAILNADDTPFMSEYSLPDELREKYGDDMPLGTAALMELVELGRVQLRRRQTMAYGGGGRFDASGYDGEDGA